VANQNQFSFPYPALGTTVRGKDQGCRVCVHQTYCPALYWFRRGGDSRGEHEEPIVDEHMGKACTAWSTNRADMVKNVTQRDLEEVAYIWYQGIGSEANRNGITSAVTGTYRLP